METYDLLMKEIGTWPNGEAVNARQLMRLPGSARGVLLQTISGHAVSVATLAERLGLSAEQADTLVTTLLDHGFDRTDAPGEDGVVRPHLFYAPAGRTRSSASSVELTESLWDRVIPVGADDDKE
jgi:hypothetical protein